MCKGKVVQNFPRSRTIYARKYHVAIERRSITFVLGDTVGHPFNFDLVRCCDRPDTPSGDVHFEFSNVPGRVVAVTKRSKLWI